MNEKNLMKTLLKTPEGVSLQQTELAKDFPSDMPGILLQINMVGLCRTDLLVAFGKIPAKKENIVLGHEFAATVVNDETGTLASGTKVGFNPLWGQEFMGLDFDGAIREFMWVPATHMDKIIPTNSKNNKLIAYLEPVAASMAVLKPFEALSVETLHNTKIAIVGNNRIASLTHTIMKSKGFEVDLLNETQTMPVNTYDYIIETVFEDAVVVNMLAALKDGGTLIVKSRKKFPVSVIASDLVARELTLKAVNYYDFSRAMRWLESHENEVAHLLGTAYSIEDWSTAFEAAQSGEQKKIFIELNK